MIKVSSQPLRAKGGETVVYPVRQRKSKAPTCPDRQVSSYLKEAFALGDFSGKVDEKLVFYLPAASPGKGGGKPVRILAVGLGKEDPDRELFRKVGGEIARAVAKLKVGKLRIRMLEDPGFSLAENAKALTEGLILGTYRFDRHKKIKKGEEPKRIREIIIHSSRAQTLRAAVFQGKTAAVAVCSARDMANEPGNFLTPGDFARMGRELAEKHGLACKVFEKAAMKKMGMGGIVAVNQGSAQPPKMVVLEYRSTGRAAPTLLLVGKGLTFDSGGISLKPGSGMEDMKYDMCGGAAVMAVMQAIGELKPDGINVVGIVPATENLPGPEALKPGDVITLYNGKTVEVINTDAEGRLILADALAYGVDKFKPAAVVDIATLTGAVIIGLGHHRTGLLGNDDKLAEKLLAIGDSCGEPSWRLPLGEEYEKQLKSEIADLKNIGGRPAGTITGACFLKEFVGDIPWAHLDIAGTAWNYTKKSYIPKGPSGVGVRTLIELVMNWK
ncbi:MAG: leucyl aminopeptidase [Desulfurivibrionaceae bacterium]|nr:leucyl aminopeptidase [Desulfobulbales bacterium]MDT8335727.1 leucyl aminopeptidase [Desulfurivibrionaceae bacterium]